MGNMNKIDILKKKIEDFYYWDSNIIYLSCQYFGDEVIMIYEDGDFNIKYTFYGCYQCAINRDTKYKKDGQIKDCTKQQIAYYLQDISVEEKDKNLLFKINAYPLDITILCERVDIKRILNVYE